MTRMIEYTELYLNDINHQIKKEVFHVNPIIEWLLIINVLKRGFIWKRKKQKSRTS